MATAVALAVHVATITDQRRLAWRPAAACMVLKYGPAQNERGVHLFGPLHGAAFLAYVGCVLAVRLAFRWRPREVLLALACSLPPFASVVLEVWAERTGRLNPERTPASVDSRPERAAVDA